MMRRKLIVALAIAGALASGCAATMRAPDVVAPPPLAAAPTATPGETRAPVAARQAAPGGAEPTPAEQRKTLEHAVIVLLGILIVVAVIKLAF